MDRNGVLLLLLLPLFFFLVDAGSVSSALVNDRVLEKSRSTGRSILQAKKSCPLNFEFMNYTVITSKCKGPRYPAKMCCEGFKEFACPYADEINDGSNDCAATMFSYINLYGKYPPGLFASECREGKEGLECPENYTKMKDNIDSGRWGLRLSRFPIFVAGLLLILLLF